MDAGRDGASGLIFNDWIALGLVGVFLGVGSPGGSWRKARVALLIALFLGMHLYPWWMTQRPWDSVMPFAYYRLYVSPAPKRVTQTEISVVAKDGGEYAIDYRIWEPLIPRFFNVLMDRHVIRRRSVDPVVGEYLLARVQEGLLERQQAGGWMPGPSEYLLGRFAYPTHQTGTRRWGMPAGAAPAPEDVASVRVYRTVSSLEQRRKNPLAFRRRLVWEGHVP